MSSLESKTVVQLKAHAKSIGLKGYSTLNKDALIKLIDQSARASAKKSITIGKKASASKKPVKKPATKKPAKEPSPPKSASKSPGKITLKLSDAPRVETVYHGMRGKVEAYRVKLIDHPNLLVVRGVFAKKLAAKASIEITEGLPAKKKASAKKASAKKASAKKQASKKTKKPTAAEIAAAKKAIEDAEKAVKEAEAAAAKAAKALEAKKKRAEAAKKAREAAKKADNKAEDKAEKVEDKPSQANKKAAAEAKREAAKKEREAKAAQKASEKAAKEAAAAAAKKASAEKKAAEKTDSAKKAVKKVQKEKVFGCEKDYKEPAAGKACGGCHIKDKKVVCEEIDYADDKKFLKSHTGRLFYLQVAGISKPIYGTKSALEALRKTQYGGKGEISSIVGKETFGQTLQKLSAKKASAKKKPIGGKGKKPVKEPSPKPPSAGKKPVNKKPAGGKGRKKPVKQASAKKTTPTKPPYVGDAHRSNSPATEPLRSPPKSASKVTVTEVEKAKILEAFAKCLQKQMAKKASK